jgi:hypothetical protein
MNKLTKKIKNKGYSLTEFCDNHLISLRSYRRYENENHNGHVKLVDWIDKLEDK